MRLYNTLTRQVEPLEPLELGLVRMYSCGPTVYRYIHIGNLRTFLMADWLRRTLVYIGLEVQHIKNITDVGHMRVELLDRGEDKLIAQARREGKKAAEIAAFYTAAFRDDERRMNILPAHVFPRATDHIPEMLAIIEGLERKGMAYVAGGNVYFDIARFPEYGKLSGNRIAELLEGVRDTTDPNKRNLEDFALWKAAEPGREMAWDSPWGRGFPGWHIECSAMAMRYLGPRFDIHTGGVDNIFPHHEGEIAQSEGYTGEAFVNHWVHAQHLLVDGLKMAKSTGNAYTLADIEARGFEPMALRYLFATVRYRAQINFTFTSLAAARTALRRLQMVLSSLIDEVGNKELPNEQTLHTSPWHKAFVTAITNDLNMPQAIACIWNMLRDRGPATPAALKLALLRDFDRVLGLGLADQIQEKTKKHGGQRTKDEMSHASVPGAPSFVLEMVRERAELRRVGRFVEADALRKRIQAADYSVRDALSGPIVEPRTPEEEFVTITRSVDVADGLDEPDHYQFSINLLARDSRADLQRCVESVVQHSNGHSLEVVIVDNGSTDDTVPYLQSLVRAGLRDADGAAIPLTVLFADHNLGFAAGRNATMRGSRGRVIVLLDTSIELRGDIWTPLEAALADNTVGVVGPYGLVTDDLKEFYESVGPEVDAVEGYLMAFRRALLPEVGLFNERFRFYRLLDIYVSFMFKTSGYRVLADPVVATMLEKHPHREWYSLSEEERAARSKKNFDIFHRRWHHGQSLLTANYVPTQRWFGHNHSNHLGAAHSHNPEDLPPPGQPHTHRHQHWADHDHEHAHYHE